MVVVAGHITVERRQRESYLAACASLVEEARRAHEIKPAYLPLWSSARARGCSPTHRSNWSNRGPPPYGPSLLSRPLHLLHW
jgi:hypothetical protein